MTLEQAKGRWAEDLIVILNTDKKLIESIRSGRAPRSVVEFEEYYDTMSRRNGAKVYALVENDHAIGLVDERAQLLHPERYRFLPSGTYQSIVCASLAENENPCIIQLGDALRAALNGAKQSI